MDKSTPQCPSCGKQELTLRIKNVVVSLCTMFYDPEHGFSTFDMSEDVSWDDTAWCVCDDCEFGAPYKAFTMTLRGRFEVLVVAYDLQEEITVTASNPEVAKRLAVAQVEERLDQVDQLIAGQVEAESVRLAYVSPDDMRAFGITAVMCGKNMQAVP